MRIKTGRYFRMLDKYLIREMHLWAPDILRVALGVVFFWFGLLKLFGISPALVVVASTYTFMPIVPFMLFLGLWEVLIGFGLLSSRFLRATVILLWLQMMGTLFSLFLAPDLFFVSGNFFALTIEGEFVIKNIVLLSASLVVGGYEITNCACRYRQVGKS